MSAPIQEPAPIVHLDLLLAQRVAEGSLRGQRLATERAARDSRWIVGVLGCRGVSVTPEDVEAAVHGTPGRFLPGQAEYELARGMRRAIDEIERSAEYGTLPDGDSIVALHRLYTSELPASGSALRDAEPWEALPGIEYPEPGQIAELLDAFDESTGFGHGAEAFAELHPARQAASVFRRLLFVAPFRDFNLTTASLAASWLLLARGYPPFLPQAADKGTLQSVIQAPDEAFFDWFTQVVLVGYRWMSDE